MNKTGHKIFSITENPDPIDDGIPVPDWCSCCECSWRGSPTETESGMDQDGWENPEYPVDLCPECGAPIDDYGYDE